jgi:hypothetical protein
MRSINAKTAFALILIFTIAFLPLFGTPSVSAAPSDEELMAAYAAYRDFIEATIEEYGQGRVQRGIYNRWEYEGLIYAELIDLNNDGIEDLLIVLGDIYAYPHYAFYTYSNGLEHLGDLHTDPLADNRVAYSRSGTAFFHLYTFDLVGAVDMYFTLTADRDWTVALSRETNTINNPQAEEVPYWLVNGIEVSQRTYNRVPETLLGITSTRNIFDWNRGRVHWNTVQDVLRTLNTRLNQMGYVAPPPGTEPDPTPSPEPDPTPSPEPDPTPTPEPDPTPSPEPDPTPSPEPDPTPSPEPEPTNGSGYTNSDNDQDNVPIFAFLAICAGFILIVGLLLRLYYKKS